MPTYTRAGLFNRRLTIQRPETTQDESGDPVVSWVDIGTVWGAAEPDRGREYYANAGIVAASPMLFRMWYLPEVTPLVRVIYRGDIYSADAAYDYRDARTETHIYARSGVNQG